MSAQTAFILFLVIVVSFVVILRNRSPERSGDLAITASINAALAKEFPFGTTQIDVKTFDGKVILGGIVREFSNAKQAEEIARAIPGVKAVESRITVRSGN